jgi:ABC-type Na+ efflux pump permease subunit
MGMFGRWVAHVVSGMIQGCVVVAIVAAVLSFAGTLVVTHALPKGLVLTLIVAVVFVSGLLGAFAMLAWRLSHISEIMHVAKEVSEHALHAPDVTPHP